MDQPETLFIEFFFSTNTWTNLGYLFLFQRCLLLQTIESNLHSYLHVLCHFICLVSLVLDIKLNTLTFKSLQHQEHIFFA